MTLEEGGGGGGARDGWSVSASASATGDRYSRRRCSDAADDLIHLKARA